MRLFAHLKSECREGLATAWKSFQLCLALGLVLGLVLAIYALNQSQEVQGIDWVLFPLMACLFGLSKGAILGTFIAPASILFRIAGLATLLPILGSILGVALGFWLGQDTMILAGSHFLETLSSRGGEMSSMPAPRHPIGLFIILPIILVHFLTSPAVWWAAFIFALAVLIWPFLGLLTSLIATVPPTLFWSAKRLQTRAEIRESSNASISAIQVEDVSP